MMRVHEECVREDNKVLTKEEMKVEEETEELIPIDGYKANSAAIMR